MRERIGEIASQHIELETPALDLSGGEGQDGLLSRLRNQNSALEKLRRALDADDDDSVYSAMASVGSRG